MGILHKEFTSAGSALFLGPTSADVKKIYDSLEARTGGKRLTKLMQKAVWFASWAHLGQTSNSGKPYLAHPFDVASQFDSPILWTICVLHDTIEDAKKNHLDISTDTLLAWGFPNEIVKAVGTLSREIINGKREPYGAFIANIGKNRLARLAKRGDIDNNLQEWRDPALVLSDRQKEKRILYIISLDYLRSINLLEEDKRETKKGTPLDVFVSNHHCFRYFPDLLNPILQRNIANPAALLPGKIPPALQQNWEHNREKLYTHSSHFFKDVAEISKSPSAPRRLTMEIKNRLDGTQYHLECLDEMFELERQADLIAFYYLRSVTEGRTRMGASVESYLEKNKRFFKNAKNPKADLEGTIDKLLRLFDNPPGKPALTAEPLSQCRIDPEPLII